MASALVTFAYVSRSRIPAAEAAAELARIVETSSHANEASGVSGALIYAGEHLAQVVEGSPESIEALRERLENDAHHEQLVELPLKHASAPRFRGWSLAYSGASSYFAGVLRELHAGKGDPGESERLVSMMRQFVERTDRP